MMSYEINVVDREINFADDVVKTGNWTLQKRTLTGKAKMEGKTIRAGPSEVNWELCIGNSSWRRFILDSDPTESRSMAALEDEVPNGTIEKWKDISFGSDVKTMEAGEIGNNSKEMIQKVYPVDRGSIEYLTDEETFKKFYLKGEKLNQLFAMSREEDTNLWQLEYSGQVGSKR